MSVGVTKDYKLKVRNLHASDTLGWSWKWVCFFWGFCVVSLQGMPILQLEERDNTTSGLAS
jgi:hypothetical protein